jgi:hypothetical protein
VVGGAVAYVEVWTDRDAVELPPGDPGNPAAPPSLEKAPRIQVDEPNFNFGSMQLGRTKSHEFVIRNVGNAPLTLTAGKPSCQCTRFELVDETVPPGGSTKGLVEWTAKQERGPFRQTAPLTTNDPLQSRFELTIEGQITEATDFSPSGFYFDKIPFGESKSAEVFVMAMLQDDLQVTAPEMVHADTRDKFDVKIEPAPPDALPNPSARAGVRITVTALPDLPIGLIHQSLSLRTNMPEAEKLEIPVVGRVVGDISVHGTLWVEEQEVLMLGSIKGSQGRKEKVNIVVRGEGAADVTFQVGPVDPSELKVTIGESRRLSDTLLHVPVEIEVPPGTRPMARLDTAQGDAGKITLKTTHPKIKELVLGVRFAVER